MKLYLYNGKHSRIIEITRATGVGTQTLLKRLKQGLTIDAAVALGREPPRYKDLTYGGETLSVEEWAKRLGMKKSGLQERLWSFRWTLEEALSTPRMAIGKKGGPKGPSKSVKLTFPKPANVGEQHP